MTATHQILSHHISFSRMIQINNWESSLRVGTSQLPWIRGLLELMEQSKSHAYAFVACVCIWAHYTFCFVCSFLLSCFRGVTFWCFLPARGVSGFWDWPSVACVHWGFSFLLAMDLLSLCGFCCENTYICLAIATISPYILVQDQSRKTYDIRLSQNVFQSQE